MTTAVIIARGGSKRIPRKNVKLFHGKPIIAYSIETAIESQLFDRVIVSTDDIEIAEIAKSYGATVPFIRKAELSTDFTTTVEVMSDAVKQLALDEHEKVCCIYATAPFLKAKDLSKAILLLEQEETKVVFAATTYSFPIQRAITINEQSAVTMIQPEHLNTRSQDLVETYHDAGQFYFSRAEYYKQKKPLFCSEAKVITLPNYRVIDIDTLSDWHRAELMYSVMHK